MHRSDGAVVAIANYVHLFSAPFQAIAEAGLMLLEFREYVISP
jgi:hypothetical protein